MPQLSDYVFHGRRKLPRRLYHYTSQAGLLGILASRSLWATRIEFLNDSTEFRYAIDLLKEALDARISAAGKVRPLAAAHKEVLNTLRLLRKRLARTPPSHTHVACFSEDPDSLSQWRGYCPGGSGFSIGFATSQLVKAAGLLTPCTYSSRKHADLIDNLLNTHVSAIIREQTKQQRRHALLATFIDIEFTACALKHPSFQDEREWRLVRHGVGDTDPKLNIRPGKNTPIPYFELQLGRAEGPAPLDVEIIVGPSPQIELAVEAVKVLMARFDCKGTCRKSTVPYREV